MYIRKYSKMRPIKSISTLTFLCALAVLLIMTAAMLAVWVPYQFESYRQQATRLEAELRVRQQQLLKEQTDRAVDYIEYMRSRIETRLRDQIKARVYEACDIALNIYHENKDKVPRPTLKKMVTDALRPIRFNQGRGYYFATRLDGVEVLYADRPEMEGRDMSTLRDLDGRYVVPDMIAIVRADGEGFYRYRWTKPGVKDQGFPKIAFVKLFEPFDWLIGSGEYLDEVEAEIKAEATERLEFTHFAKDGYIFVGRYDGVAVTRPNKGRNMIGVTDVNGVKIVQELIAAAEKGGGFVEYIMPSLEGFVAKPKISYVRGIPEWQWYVGAGMYVDNFRELNKTGQADLKRQLGRKGLELLPIFWGAILLALAVSWIVYTRIRKERDIFDRFFKQAAERYEAIDENKLSFTEFRSLAAEANIMIAAREEAMRELQRSEERFKELAESLPETIFEMDLQGNLTFVNRRAFEQFGYTQQDFEHGLNTLDMLIPEDRTRAGENMAKTMGSKEAGLNEYTALCKNGGTFACLIFSAPIRHDGRAVGLRGFIVDITQRKKAEEALQVRERYYRSLISNLHEDILVVDRNYTITDVNNSFLVTTGHRREDVVGRTCHEIRHGCDRPCREYGEVCGLEDVFASDRAISCTKENLNKDGTKIVVDILYSPLKDENGNITHVIQAVRDITEVVRIKDELRRSEEKFRMISTAARDAIMMTDENGKITYWNPAAEQLFGFSVQEAVEADLPSLILPVRERDHLRRGITQYDTGGTSAGELIEVLALKKDGSKVPVELSISVGNLEGRRSAILLIRDITKPRQVRETLRQSEEKYRSLYSAMSEGVALHEILHDRTGQASDYILLDVNPAFESITGLKKETVVGRPASKLFGAESAPYLEIYAGVAATGEPDRFETYFPPMEKHFSISVFSLGDRRFATVFEDITGRKQADEVLKESEERFRVLFEYAPDPFYIIDMNGVLADGNQAAEKLLGYQKDELIGIKIFEAGIISDADLPKALSLFERNRNGAQTGSDEFMLYRKDGEVVYAEVSTHPVTIRGEKFVLGIARDSTERRKAEQERKKLEDQLRQAQKMEAIGTFAGGIAHDFNNILSAIMGYTELAKDKASQNTPLHDDLQEVFRAGLRARDLVKQILTFSRQADQKMQPVRMDLIVKEALKFLRASLPADIEVCRNIASDARVLADPTQLHQVLMNLCANARHAMGQTGGKLEVSLVEVQLDADFAAAHSGALTGAHLKLTVADSGEGMPAEVREKIFEPFFTTKGKEEGTGLGLAVVHGIVKSSGGFISVYSEPGQGTAFNVFLPVIEARDKPPAKIKGPLPAGTERVLLVDDEKILTDIGAQMLERHGYRVTVRTSSVEALALFKAKPDQFDLVITDLTMPNLSGLELAAEIIAQRPEVPIILCTGFSAKITPAGAESAGIKALIMKPISRDDLIRTARRVLDECK